MALSNIANWNEDKTAASCGTACGASEKPAGSNRPEDDCSEPTGAERRQPAALKAWCRGCPAVANGMNGDFYSADPQCWKTKNEITREVLPC